MIRKVLVIVPFAMSDDNLALRQQQLQGIDLSPDLQFEFRPVKAGPVNYSSHHDFVLADAANFEAGCRAEAEGFSAVCIDTMSDSGVAALRSVLRIPVFGPGKASMLTALMLAGSVQAATTPAPLTALQTLQVSYRSTHPITRFALDVLGDDDEPAFNPFASASGTAPFNPFAADDDAPHLIPGERARTGGAPRENEEIVVEMLPSSTPPDKPSPQTFSTNQPRSCTASSTRPSGRTRSKRCAPASRACAMRSRMSAENQ